MSLMDELGRTLTVTDMAKLLRLDRRDVKKHYTRWGGVEFLPGKIRFFENQVKAILSEASESQAQRAMELEAFR